MMMTPLGPDENQAMAGQNGVPPSSQLTALQRARLRWRARRGLLENDLILTAYLDRHELDMSVEDVSALSLLLQMGDNELLDVLLGLADLPEGYDTPAVRALVVKLQQQNIERN